MITQLQKLEAIRSSLNGDYLSENRAQELLGVLDNVQSENDFLNLQLSSVRILTVNLMAESARAGQAGMLSGLGAQHVGQRSEFLQECSKVLQQHISDLEDEIVQQIEGL